MGKLAFYEYPLLAASSSFGKWEKGASSGSSASLRPLGNDVCPGKVSAPPATVRFQASLRRLARPKRVAWAFLVLASGKLPTRSQVAVEGTFAGAPFRATLEPDGQGSHWLKVEKALL